MVRLNAAAERGQGSEGLVGDIRNARDMAKQDSIIQGHENEDTRKRWRDGKVERGRGHLGIARLPQLGSMNNPEAFPAVEVEDVGWWLLAKLVKRGRVAGL